MSQTDYRCCGCVYFGFSIGILSEETTQWCDCSNCCDNATQYSSIFSTDKPKQELNRKRLFEYPQ